MIENQQFTIICILLLSKWSNFIIQTGKEPNLIHGWYEFLFKFPKQLRFLLLIFKFKNDMETRNVNSKRKNIILSVNSIASTIAVIAIVVNFENYE